jgi:hypothetical protein
MGVVGGLGGTGFATTASDPVKTNTAFSKNFISRK